MKYIVILFSIVLLFSLGCAIAIADSGLTEQQEQLLENGCGYTTVLGGCRHEHT